MFNGHLDHVRPAGMEDPYGARIVPGESYGTTGTVLRGRGSCDMKANVAAGAYAVAFLPPRAAETGSYRFTADVQEETDSPAGVRALIERGVRAECGVNATFISAAGIPCIGIGPGNENWAHTSDEHVPIAQVTGSSRIYAELLARLTSQSAQDVGTV
jgi:acetylornithine deacetylase/succinyl-diaminopimelate desuccinylase-like protein